MQLKTGLMIAGLILGFAPSVQAYPMTGIDGRFLMSTSSQTVELRDEKGNPLIVHEGFYRMRFSGQSKSIHFMESENSLQTIKLPMGFPGGDLRNFVLRASDTGQPVDLIGRTWDERGPEHTYRTRETCRMYCGHERICDGPDPWDHHMHCYYRDRYCSGYRDIEVTEVTVDRKFSMAMRNQSQEMGIFKGLVQSTVNRVSSDPISSCYY